MHLLKNTRPLYDADYDEKPHLQVTVEGNHLILNCLLQDIEPADIVLWQHVPLKWGLFKSAGLLYVLVEAVDSCRLAAPLLPMVESARTVEMINSLDTIRLQLKDEFSGEVAVVRSLSFPQDRSQQLKSFLVKEWSRAVSTLQTNAALQCPFDTEFMFATASLHNSLWQAQESGAAVLTA